MSFNSRPTYRVTSLEVTLQSVSSHCLQEVSILTRLCWTQSSQHIKGQSYNSTKFTQCKPYIWVDSGMVVTRYRGDGGGGGGGVRVR